MKHTLPILALVTIALPSALPAAVALRWTVETSRAQVAQFEAYRGETLDLEATMKSYGSPLATPVQPSLYWQTNGMDDAWWSSPASAASNVLHATFSPEMDPGAKEVMGFIGSAGENYRAAFVLRFRHGPGAVPNELELPRRSIDFAAVEVKHAPWPTRSEVDRMVCAATNYTDAALGAFAATGAVARATVYGTPTRWTDATGTVWQVEQRLVGDLYLAGDREFENKSGPYGFDDSFYVVQKGSGYEMWLNDYGEMEGYQMSQVSGHEGWWEEARSYGTYFFSPSYVPVTNLVGRVAYTNDIPDVSGYATSADVTAAIREQSLGGIWDETLQVWWTPHMRNGSLTYEAKTNVNLNAEN